ncbi:hypothetical protein KAFR_0C06250 [Kazachstania africana CBS 2517]|uniref:Cargo-transport protein YPP1 n=1 Tax=Kazachstania africana (strain ATCC 22294 / BCRC 22015 / CBS 2517 / CECT 1963 / NBRC 1671 / NRRL Y-8276) TaxID=1071382 RepID=H2ATB7_KAZAF|nr:hypothetical protein KAFR_0C06250 [Kazachstania africana CBS 2517]CCF57617.1 hypothetical protein KAFR_0C06250 [Kazachstania africana CBS 2517]
MPSMTVQTVSDALIARLLGASEFDSGNSVVDLALNLHFRIYFHLFNGTLQTETIKILLTHCDSLQTTLNSSIAFVNTPDCFNLLQKTLYNMLAVLYFHYGYDHIATVQKNLTKSKKIIIDNYSFFIDFLNLENLYYTKVSSKSPITSDDLLSILDYIPIKSYGLTHYYLELIACANGTQLKQNGSPLICYVSILGNNKNLQNYNDEFVSIGKEILQNSHFPKSTESTDFKLEQFNFFLQYYLPKIKQYENILPKWQDFIIQSMSKSFQNITVAKTAMIFFNLIDNKVESILNFNNFIRYNGKLNQLNNESDNGKQQLDLYDIVALVDSYRFILNSTTSADSIGNIFDFDDIVKELRNKLFFLYEHFKISLNDKNSIKLTFTKIRLPKSVSKILSDSWETLYQINSNDLKQLISNDLIFYLSNALSLHSNDSLLFYYAYTLAQQRNIDHCIKFLETKVLIKNPNHFKAWHLLALCHSIKENKESSYKIIISIIDTIENHSNAINKLSYETKWNLINFKITQIYLIKDIFGNFEALDQLPDLFTTFNSLFGETIKKTETNITHSFSQSKEYLLQMIWLLAAELYMSSSDLPNAKQAIEESMKLNMENKSFRNLNCDIIKAKYSTLIGDANEAQAGFESVLYHDILNLDALVGLSKLVFPDDDTTANHLKLTTIEDVKKLQIKLTFVDKTDKAAAHARMKLLLENSTLDSIDCYFSPEIWWYLSLIYEISSNKDFYEEALLNCVKNYETNPIRSFKFSNF